MLPRPAQGVDSQEVFISDESGISLNFSSGEIKSKEQTSEKGFGLRVLKDGRLGFSYCEEEKDIPTALERAARLSSYSPKTGFSFSPKAAYPRLDLVDAKVRDAGSAELKGMLGQMRDGIEREGGKPRVMLSAGIETVTMENSAGFSGSYSSTAMAAYCESMMGDGYGFAYEEGIHMPKDFTAIGIRAGRMAKDMRKAKKLKPGSYDVIFTRDALEDLLYILLPSFSGEWKRKGTTLFADKLGKKVFDSGVSIYDDALAVAGDSKPFDDEGTVSRKIPIIENGVLKNFIYDRETAALEGIAASGFCSRSHFSTPPSASRSNLVIGTGEYGNLQEELDSWVIVHALHGSHTANTTTGDFGLEVNVAFHKSGKGKEPKPVRGFLLSGNVFKLLEGNIYIERKAETEGSLIAPRLAFGNVRVVS